MIFFPSDYLVGRVWDSLGEIFFFFSLKTLGKELDNITIYVCDAMMMSIIIGVDV